MILEALQTSLKDLRQAPLSNVLVAVIDTGIDSSHPKLDGKIVKAIGIESQHEGVASAARRMNHNNDSYGHGTNVAGIICQIAPNAQLIDIDVLGDDATSSGDFLIEGFQVAIESEAKIINLSLAAKRTYKDQLAVLCEKAYQAGKIVVAAQRNNTLFDVGLPAELSSTISVNISSSEEPFTFHFNENSIIEFGAFGTQVSTYSPNLGYTKVSGTSFATPSLAGVCALLLGRYPDLTFFEIKTLLKHFSSTQTGV